MSPGDEAKEKVAQWQELELDDTKTTSLPPQSSILPPPPLVSPALNRPPRIHRRRRIPRPE